MSHWFRFMCECRNFHYSKTGCNFWVFLLLQPDLILLLLLPHNLTGVNFKEVNEDNKQKLFGEIYTAIDTLAFTFGNV